MTLGADGSYAASFTMTCEAGGSSGTGEGHTTGTYTRTGTTLAITGLDGGGTLDLGGVNAPFDLDGFLDGEWTVAVLGDTMTWDGGPIHLTFTRVG
jgi:hypothetical protein